MPSHAYKPSLRRLLADGNRFLTVAELIAARGMIMDQAGGRVLRLAAELAENDRIDAVSITDNAGGNPMNVADMVGGEVLARGQEVIIHVTCKDRNRNALESLGWKLASAGFGNILCLSGDYPASGNRGHASGVFDVDSVGLLRLYSDLNAGLEVGGTRLLGAGFILGCVVTNHKLYEREVVPQYLKLRKKIENGASFVINQIGYHARKDDELLRWLELNGIQIPVLSNVYVLSRPAARAFHAGRIPGVVVTDELLDLVERSSGGPDRGRAFFLELAAKQVAIARGLGFRGTYIGGHLDPENYNCVLEQADSFAPDDWRLFAREIQFPQPGEFHFFERDPATALSSSEPSRELAASRRPWARRRARLRVSLNYRLGRRLHRLALGADAPFFGAGRAFYSRVERAPRVLGRTLHAAEHATKAVLYGCRDCGDCSLPDIAYLCPESRCAKNQRNGPCGGTRDGKCEVGERECIWALAYERLKAYGMEETMLDGHAILKDGALRWTSAWANTFLGRDHHGRERGES